MMVKNKNRLYSLVSLLIGILILISSWLLTYNLNSRGFPDGHKTSMDIAEISLLRPFTIVSMLFSFFFLGLTFASSKKKISTLFKGGLVFYAILLVIVIVIEFYFMYVLKLEDGIGG